MPTDQSRLLPALLLLGCGASWGAVAGATWDNGAAPVAMDDVDDAGAAAIALPPRVADWLPSDWWSPAAVVSGRIDQDALDDLVILVERRTDAPQDLGFPRGSRGLLMVFGEPDGGWRRGQMAAELLPCIDCVSSLSGRIGSAVFNLDIPEDGLVEVGWVEGGPVTKAVQLSLGWDEAHGAVGLDADDIMVIRPQGGRGRIRRDYRAGRMWVDGVVREMPARFIPIEEVSADQY